MKWPILPVDSLYSYSLLLALVAGVLSVITALLQRLKPSMPGSGGLGWGLSRPEAVAYPTWASLFGLAVSMGVHFWWGHRPGSDEALAWSDFFVIHPAFLLVAALPGLAATIRWLTRRREKR